MNYAIKIVDKQHLEDELILHYAERNSINLSWIGGDGLLEPIVPADFVFTLEVFGAMDGKYDQYFTTDEKRYEVTKEVMETGEIVFRGFLLPESYSEPYDKAIFYVNFSATDGLGLLKGKELPPDFYSEEKTVIEVVSECLSLTEIDFDIYFSPAIENHLKKTYHEIFLDTLHYFKKDKLPTAYDFLYELMSSMQCQLFQCEGRWYIEGINKRHLLVVKYWKYSIAGEYLGTQEITRNIKKVSWLTPAPNITMVAGLNKVVVTHTAPNLNFERDVYQENELEAIAAVGTDRSFLPKHWNYVNFFPRMHPSDYFLALDLDYGPSGSEYDENLKIELRDKPFVLKGTKLKLDLSFQFSGDTSDSYSEMQTNGELKDMQPYRISLGDQVLISNYSPGSLTNPATLNFDSNGFVEKTIEFIAPNDGFIGIELFRPLMRSSGGAFGGGSFGRLSVLVQEINLHRFEEQEDFVYTLNLAENSSVVQEVDLDIADDYTQNSKCFYLEKVRETEFVGGSVIEIPILYARQQNGKNYSIVSLNGAKLIDRNPDSVSWNIYINKVNNPVVHFNINGGDEMAIETESYYASGKFFVTIRPLKKPQISRLEWLKWSDSIYGIEKKLYAQVVAEIRSRIFSFPHLKVDGVSEVPYKFNDLVEFSFKGKNRYFVPTDIEWDPYEGECRLKIVEGIYSGESLGNIAPYVDAGPDIFISGNETTAQITEAVVLDPDGTAPVLLWEQISAGDPVGFSSAASLNPLVNNITGAVTTLRLSATDPGGAFGSDTMNIYRRKEYLFGAFRNSTVESGSNGLKKVLEIWSPEITPEIPEGEQVNLNFNASMWIDETIDLSTKPVLIGYIEIWKNGVKVFSLFDDTNIFRFFSKHTYNAVGVVSYTAGDIIEVKFYAEKSNKDKTNVINESVTFTTADFVQVPHNEMLFLPRTIPFDYV